jgi:hypothetical protein
MKLHQKNSTEQVYPLRNLLFIWKHDFEAPSQLVLIVCLLKIYRSVVYMYGYLVYDLCDYLNRIYMRLSRLMRPLSKVEIRIVVCLTHPREYINNIQWNINKYSTIHSIFSNNNGFWIFKEIISITFHHSHFQHNCTSEYSENFFPNLVFSPNRPTHSINIRNK